LERLLKYLEACGIRIADLVQAKMYIGCIQKVNKILIIW